MFEKKLQEQVQKIFSLKKVTFDAPGESQEQEAAFIQIENAKTRVKDGREIAQVAGTIRVFAPSNKLPYGFFAKQIDKASAEDRRGFFFHSFEENKGKFRNIVERSVQFQYLFDSQYDPALGSIESVNFEISET